MKVLFVNTNYHFGGAARAARRIMDGVCRLGIQCQYFSKGNDINPSTADERLLVLDDFHSHSWIDKAYSWCYRKLQKAYQLFQWRHINTAHRQYYLSDFRSEPSHRALHKIPFDILHLHWVNGQFFNLQQLRHIHKPIVWTLHDSWPFCGVCHYFLSCESYKSHCGSCPMLKPKSGSPHSRDLAYSLFEQKRKLYAHLNLHIVAPSHWMARAAQESALLGGFPISVIPNCIDVNLYRRVDYQQAAARWIPDACSKKSYILFGAVAATSDTIKGFRQLVTALRLFEQQFDCSNVELLIFGSDTPVPGLDLHIPSRYLGYVNNEADMAKLYSLAHVVVVPSQTENLCGVIMESLSCSTPVVAFNIGGNSDMIDHQQNGYLAIDEADMARGIAWCLQNNTDRHLGDNARQKVLSHFAPEVVSRQYAALYQSLLER